MATLVGLAHGFAKDTIGNPSGCFRAVDVFISTHDFYLFPYLRYSWITRSLSSIGLTPSTTDIHAPRWLVEITIKVLVPLLVWQSFVMVHEFLAFFTIITGIVDAEIWGKGLFHQPWKADSVIDFWGYRWHQLLRVPRVVHNQRLRWIADYL